MLCSWGSVEVWPEQVFSNRLYIVCIIHSYISFILFHCSSIPPPLYFSLIFIFWVKDISQLFLSDRLRVSLLSIFLMYYTYSCHHHRYFLSTIGQKVGASSGEIRRNFLRPRQFSLWARGGTLSVGRARPGWPEGRPNLTLLVKGPGSGQIFRGLAQPT